MAYGLLFEVSKHIVAASYNCRACYRGETPLDAHAARRKGKIGEVAVEKWPNRRPVVEKVVIDASTSLGDTGAIFLDSTQENRGYRNNKFAFKTFPAYGNSAELRQGARLDANCS